MQTIHSSTSTAPTSDKQSTSHDPLLNGLVCLLNEQGIQVDAERLCFGVPLKNSRIAAQQMPQLLERQNISARLSEVPLKDIPDCLCPCLLLLKNGSCVILLAHDGQLARLRSPLSGGELKMPLARLANLFSGWTLFANPRSQLNRAESYAEQSQGHWLKARLLKRWRTFMEVAVASLLASLLAIATALFAMQVYDRVVPTSAFGTLWALSIGVFLAITFEFLIKSLRAQLVETLGKRLDLELSQYIFQHALHLRLASRPASLGVFASQIRDFEAIREFFTASSLGAFGDLPFVLMFLALIAYIGGPIVTVPVLAIALMLLPALLAQPWLARLSRQGMRESAVKNGVLLETIDNLESLKANRAEGRAQQLWKRLCEEQAERGVSFRHANAWLMGWSTAAQQLAYISVIIYGVYQIEAGELSVGALIACSILTSRAIAPTLQITGLLARWQHIKVAMEGLEALMDLPVERPAARRFIRLQQAKGAYELQATAWRYDEQSPQALKLDQLTIKAGEHLALLGGNGSGKTTLLRVLAGLYSPSSGEVRLDDRALNQIDPDDRSRAIGYMPQDIALFHGTLRDNLTLDGRHFSDEHLLNVMHMVGLNDFICRHPLGLDMPLQDSRSLSGGQRQSVGLARLILQDPAVVLLDEPTSALDQNTEIQVIANLKPWLQQRTLVMATHKRALLQWVERAVVLHNGARLADGPVADVLHRATLTTAARQRAQAQ